jgi:hypothetical protein
MTMVIVLVLKSLSENSLKRLAVASCVRSSKHVLWIAFAASTSFNPVYNRSNPNSLFWLHSKRLTKIRLRGQWKLLPTTSVPGI